MKREEAARHVTTRNGSPGARVAAHCGSPSPDADTLRLPRALTGRCASWARWSRLPFLVPLPPLTSGSIPVRGEQRGEGW